MELLHAKDIDGRLPWELARDCGHDELASYLFCRTVRFEIGRLSTMPFQGLTWLTELRRTVHIVPWTDEEVGACVRICTRL